MGEPAALANLLNAEVILRNERQAWYAALKSSFAVKAA